MGFGLISRSQRLVKVVGMGKWVLGVDRILEIILGIFKMLFSPRFGYMITILTLPTNLFMLISFCIILLLLTF